MVEHRAATWCQTALAASVRNSFLGEPEDPSTVASELGKPSSAPEETRVSTGEHGCAVEGRDPL